MKKLLSLVKFALRFTFDFVGTLVVALLMVVVNLAVSIYFAIKFRDIKEIPKSYIGAWKAEINGAKEGFQTHKCVLLSILES